jgi:type II secretory pathway component PulL
MSIPRISDSLLDNYVALFDQLNTKEQAVILNRLASTRNKDIPDVVFLPEPENAWSLEELAGSWDDERSAEEIVADLRQSRTPNLDRVNL